MDQNLSGNIWENDREPSYIKYGKESKQLRFADLFSGLGGFHVGLSTLGLECVFASELDPSLRQIYFENFGLLPEGDIRLVDEKSISPHEILCAGFPCQPFSLAGKRKGTKCPESGKLIDDVIRIAKHHKPKYVLLENVPNILTIADGKFWAYIKSSFSQIGYSIDYKIYSPHQFGIPQKRERVFVVASRESLSHFSWPEPSNKKLTSLNNLVEEVNVGKIREIEPAKLAVLNKWQELVAHVKVMRNHSIIASEFGATYPIDDIKSMPLNEVRKYKGAFGKPLSNCKTWEDVKQSLPNYLRNENYRIPDWIRSSVIHSRNLYETDPSYFDEWKKDLISAHNSWQRLEWRGMRDNIDIWQHVIQFRASGIRILRAEYAPSLVAMTPTQTPILGAKKRYLSVSEAAALQSLQSLKSFPKISSRAFKALGNAVNAYIVKEITKNLISDSH